MNCHKNTLRDAIILARNGNNQEAISILNQLIIDDPYNSKFIHQRGKVFCKLKNYDLSLEDFNNAIKIDKTVSVYYGNRGILHYKLKNLTESERDLRYALYLSKGRLHCHYTLGKLYYDSEDIERAVSCLKKALYKKENSDAHKLLALCYLKQENYTNALHELIYAEAENPNDHWIQFSIGRCYYIYAAQEMGFAIKDAIKETIENTFEGFKPVPEATEYYAQAKNYLTKSIELNPTYPYGYWMRGACNYCLGFLEESAADYSNAIKYKPDQVEFYEGWEMAHIELE